MNGAETTKSYLLDVEQVTVYVRTVQLFYRQKDPK